MTVGEKIKVLRGKKGLTQKDLADKLFVSFQTISKWENNENEPSISSLRELAKILECSLDFLLNEDEIGEKTEKIEEEKESKVETLVQPSVQIIHQRESHVCERCKKDIDELELVMEPILVSFGGRGRAASYRQGYYHKRCLNIVKKEKEEKEQYEKNMKARKNKIKCFASGIVGAILAFVVSLWIFIGSNFVGSTPVYLAIVYSIFFGYAGFATLFCIFANSYISDVFFAVASKSIKLPGIIFEFSFDGLKFLIFMKLLFVVIGFLFGIAVILLAIFLSMALSVVSFPFVLISNIKNNYETC